MPAEVTLDLTGLWHRETELVGAYTYGTETLPTAAACARSTSPSRPPTPSRPSAGCRPPIRLADHVDAIAHAAAAGRRGAVKIAFDLRKD